jgi:hypothetical protein
MKTSGGNSESPALVFLPSSAGWFCLYFCAAILFGCPGMMLADGAVARHIVTGVDIITKNVIPTANYVWAINPNAAWTTHELAGDLVFGFAHLWWHLNGVVLVGALTIGISLMWSYQMSRVRGLGALTSWLVFMPVFLSTSLHWLSRSHIFSYLFFLIVYYLTFVSKASWKVRLIATAVAMMLWANFHGSIFLGLMMLVLKPVADWLENYYRDGTKDFIETIQGLWILLAGAVGAAINIRGASFYTYMYNYLTHQQIVGRGSEWRSLDFSMGIGIWCFLAAFVILWFLYTFSPRKPRLAEWLLMVALFGGSVHAMRLIPYFALLLLPAIGPSYEAIRNQLLSTESPKSVFQRALAWWVRLEEKIEAKEIYSPTSFASKSILLVALSALFVLLPKFAVAEFPQPLPVKALNYMEENKIRGLGFTFDNWGPYIYYRQRVPIFIDEKTDFYPADFLEDYRDAFEAKPNYPDVFTKYKIEYVLVPSKAPLAKALANNPQWTKRYGDEFSVLYLPAEPDSPSSGTSTKPRTDQLQSAPAPSRP